MGKTSRRQSSVYVQIRHHPFGTGDDDTSLAFTIRDVSFLQAWNAISGAVKKAFPSKADLPPASEAKHKRATA